MPDETGGGGNFLTRKFGPLPAWAYLVGAALIGYWWISHHSSSSSSTPATGAKSTGGGGTATTTGNTVIRKGAIVIRVNQGTEPEDNDQPQPPTHGGGGGKHTSGTVYRHVVSEDNLSLDSLAKGRHTTVAHLIDVSEHGGRNMHMSPANLAKFEAYVKGGTDKPMPKGLVYYTSTGPPEG